MAGQRDWGTLRYTSYRRRPFRDVDLEWTQSRRGGPASEGKPECKTDLAWRIGGPERQWRTQFGRRPGDKAPIAIRAVQEIHVPLSGGHNRRRGEVGDRIGHRRVREDVVHGTEIRVIEDVGRLRNQVEAHTGVSVQIQRLRDPYVASRCNGTAFGGGQIDQIQSLLGHASVQTTERYLDSRRKSQPSGEPQARNRERTAKVKIFIAPGGSRMNTSTCCIAASREHAQLPGTCATKLGKRWCSARWEVPGMGFDSLRGSTPFAAQCTPIRSTDRGSNPFWEPRSAQG